MAADAGADKGPFLPRNDEEMNARPKRSTSVALAHEVLRNTVIPTILPRRGPAAD
jgi:hypothetical protein